MKFLTLVFFVSTALLLLNNCDSTNPKLEPDLLLKLEDVSCTEAWLQLTTNNIQLPAIVNLKQSNPAGDTKSHIFNLNTKDSLFYIDSLLPNQTYKLQVSNIQNQVSSNELSITTLDTTSHNFTWQTFEFGQHSSSVLYDVAIIDENNIWAVGEIYMNDSLGQPIRYNAVHWDGQSWELKRIMFFTICGQQSRTPYPAKAIFAFNENEIWIAMDGDQIVKLENGIQVNTICLPWSFSINKMWGNRSNDVFVVGSAGNIAHYQNGSWTKIESRTTLALLDIYGNTNNQIYTCGGNYSTGQGVICKININNTVTKVIDSYYFGNGFDSTKMFTENLYGPINSFWIDNNDKAIAVGHLIYRYKKGTWDYQSGIEYNYLSAGSFTGRGYLYNVRGVEINDFFFVGQRNTIRHFNGINALQLGEPFSYTSEYSWIAVDYKNNLAVTVGRKGGQAAVNIFKR
ncbi:MAG: glucosyl transferase [Ignavibacteriaceae bacterium]|nr:glucosyl transferase [Ignavibacteriaceae bacterium]HRN27991.1 glucosyl transferase [Ignavibacteriaceae bacterium]HRP92165.1 glucosyl transferase [Ignavibacteriaceae bacterium]HRQ55715.1 glucosyl transferase [Ignavibacteriaceae bacterium]